MTIKTLEMIKLLNREKFYCVREDIIYVMRNNNWVKKDDLTRQNLVNICYCLNLVDDEDFYPMELEIAANLTCSKIRRYFKHSSEEFTEQNHNNT